jgi:hypothetical protein
VLRSAGHWLALTAALLALLVLLAPVRGRAAAADPLDRLLAEYRAHGLPLPPATAKLVLVDSGWSTSVGGRQVRLLQVGFLTGTGKTARLLLGTTRQPPPRGRRPLRVIPPDPRRIPWQRLRAGHKPRHFELNAALAAAIQCRALGHRALARRLLTFALGKTCGHHFSAFFQPAGLSADRALAHLVWAHLGNELTRPGSDRRRIAARIKRLLAAHTFLDSKKTRPLVRSLRAALKRGRGKPGSVAAQIDALVEAANRPAVAGQARHPPQRQRLLLLGFRAVPELIRHLDDERLTRFVYQGFNNFPPWIVRVQHLVSDLLRGIAGQDLGQDWLRRQQGWPVTRQAALAWWKRASAAGEEAWLLKHVLPAGKPAGKPKRARAWPNLDQLAILAARHPRRLPGVYRTLLKERTPRQSWPVVDAIAASGLPRQTRLSLLLAGARHADLEHRRAALWKLKDLDPRPFNAILIETLERIPRTPKGPYWSCREAAFTHLVIESTDEAAWRALLATARRVDVGLRMELLNPMDYANKPHRKRRLRFLAAFLGDAAVRDASSKSGAFSGPHAGFTFPRLAVRDLAAWKIASILGLGATPRASWSARRWAGLRARVKRRLAKELQPK